METHGTDLEETIAEVAVATAFVLVAGLLLWPPRNVYWEQVGALVGDDATSAFVAVLAAGLGAWFARTSGLSFRHVVAGATLAYVAGMAAVEVVLQPDSPVHLLWYGLVLAALLAGVLGWETLRWYVDRG